MNDDAAERHARFLASLTPWGEVRRELEWYYILFIFPVVALSLCSSLLVLSESFGGGDWLTHRVIAATFFGTMAVCLGIAGAARVLSAVAIHRYHAWERRLPFALTGLSAMLEAKPSSHSERITFTMHFGGTPPTREELKALFAGEVGEWHFSEGSHLATRTPGLSGDRHNRELYLWFRQLADEQLRLLRERHGLAAVTLR